MDWLVTSHSHIMELPTMNAWTIMELIGVEQMLAGVFALIPAMTILRQVS